MTDDLKAMRILLNVYLYIVYYEKTDRFTSCIFVHLQFMRGNGVSALLHG